MLVFYGLTQEELGRLSEWLKPVQMTEKLLEFLPIVYMERIQVLDDDGSEEDVDFFGDSEDSADGELNDNQLMDKVCEITQKLKELKKQKKQFYDEDAHDNLIGVDEVNFRDYLDDLDEILGFEKALNGLETVNPELFAQIRDTIAPARLSSAKTVFDKARKDNAEKDIKV
jgi:hypothetical protein